MNEWLTDRTRILDFQACPRKRYWSHHYQGKGMQRVAKSLPLVFGAAFHEGCEVMLRPSERVLRPEDHIDIAVAKAVQYLDQAFAERGVDLDDPNAGYAMAEQKAIAEGLLRGWWVYEGEAFLAQFEVLEVEQEGRAELGDGVVLLFRPDAVVRERSSGDVYVVSWKTESMHGQHSVNRAMTDMQSLSEVWGVQNARGVLGSGDGVLHTGVGGAAAPDDRLDNRGEGASRVEGVLYKFAVKGQRRMDDYLGFKVQDTPLTYGWTRGTGDQQDWAWKYKWQTEELNPKTGRPAWTQLPKGFRKVPIWQEYPGGVKAWVEALAAGEVQPRHVNALEGVFPQSLPVSRRADEIESWRLQTREQERRVQDSMGAIAFWTRNHPNDHNEALDYYAPQHTARCFDYNSRCPFWEACFTPAVHADPLASELYQIRVSNHPEKESNDD